MVRPITKKIYDRLYNAFYKVLVTHQGKWDTMDQINDNLYTLCDAFDKEWNKPPNVTQRQAAYTRLENQVNKELDNLEKYKKQLEEIRILMYAYTLDKSE